MMRVQKNFYNLNHEIELFKESINRKDILNFIIIFLILLVSNIALIDIINTYNVINFRIVMYDIIISVSVLLVSIFSLLNKREIIKLNKKIDILEEINKNLTEVADKMRCFKHDFRNILQALDGYIFLQDIHALQVYFSALLKECNYANTVEFLNNKIIENPAIYGILVNKYKIAEENDIEMNIDIIDGLSRLDEKSYIVSRMVGILLDNALEATKDCEKKVINVQFLKQEDTKRKIIIENTYSNKDVDTTKIFNKNYTTKSGSGNSGLGLWKIKNILNKDSNFKLLTTKDETMFRQQLEININ